MKSETETQTQPAPEVGKGAPTPFKVTDLFQLNYRLLQLSILFTLAAVAFTISTFGQFSLWLPPAMAVFSLPHNVTLLVLSWRERTGRRRVLGSSWSGVSGSEKELTPVNDSKKHIESERLPATSTLPSLITTFILALMWASAFGLTLGLTITALPALYDKDGWSTDDPRSYRVLPWFECIFAFLEMVVLVLIGVGGVRERKAVLGLREGGRVWVRL
ncbi:hypothetical protein CVT26_003294 [Gymnopilus dilepis]|uniref:Uncharacterized protein n=1 Tax=Gymnopilus dilepis TaxID=231916 RepID=A0A409Y505_9AGAR|nr:hypothetical protein CVT26_003294 [Gymnopilus dilepis]